MNTLSHENQKPHLSARAAAARAVRMTTSSKRSLSVVLAELLPLVAPEERGLAQELIYGTLRHHGHLFSIARALLWKPLETQDRIIFCLLLVGLYQLEHMRIPDHAALNETVKASEELRRPRSAAMVNAVLRNWRRKREEVQRLITAESGGDFRFSFPPWVLKRLRKEWPQQEKAQCSKKKNNKESPTWKKIVDYSNARPPLCVRVNPGHWSREECMAHFRKLNYDAKPTEVSADGLILGRRAISKVIELIKEGALAAQDESAQLATALLAPKDGEQVLDMCAAPGGKACHILEMAPGAILTATDLSVARLRLVAEACKVRKQKPILMAADALGLGRWWPGQYDAVLVDAPCSGMGVLNRHPDIKHLRRETDIAEYAKLQHTLLRSAWRLVAPGGRMLYVTCTLFRDENQKHIKRFLGKYDASLEDPGDDYGVDTGHGRQRLPGVHHGDGFFYALLRKGTGDGAGDVIKSDDAGAGKKLPRR